MSLCGPLPRSLSCHRLFPNSPSRSSSSRPNAKTLQYEHHQPTMRNTTHPHIATDSNPVVTQELRGRRPRERRERVEKWRGEGE